jgi:O-succinylbenzoate synthase
LASALREVEMRRAKRTGEPLGAADSEATAPASTSEKTNHYLPVAALLPAGKAALERVAVLGDAGFRTFKWKVGVGDVADELGLAEDLLGRLPTGAKLRLDANGAWNHRQAQKWLERAADWPIEFLEQPIAAGARGFEDTMLGLAADYPTPLALDESIATGAHVARWIELGWRGVFVVKPALLGDVEGTLARIQKSMTTTSRVVFSSALETAIGAKRALQIALDHGEAGRAIGFGVWPLFADVRLNGPALAPFIRREDVERVDTRAAWESLGE